MTTAPVKLTKKLTYTGAFREHFQSRFDESANENLTWFDISVDQFDQFLVDKGFVDYVPAKTSKEWDHFLAARNDVRISINSVGERGTDGGEAFRIEVPKDHDNKINRSIYRVSLFVELCDKEAYRVLAAIKTFVANKKTRYSRLTEFMSKHASKLPGFIQISMGSQERELKRFLSMFGSALKDYCADVEATYRQAIAILGKTAPETLEEAPNGEQLEMPLPAIRETSEDEEDAP